MNSRAVVHYGDTPAEDRSVVVRSIRVSASTAEPAGCDEDAPVGLRSV
jgi:hypothetical protein